MKRRLIQYLFELLTLIVVNNGCSINSTNLCSVKDYQELMRQNYSCGVKIKPKLSKVTSSQQSNKRLEKIEKVESKNLLLWLKEMKEMWKDFPVYRQIKTNKNSSNDKIFTKKYFESCKFDKIEKGLEKGFFQKVNGTLEGTGVLTFDGKGSSCFSKHGAQKINGTFARGQLEGMATILFHNGSFFRAPFSNGAISGLARSFSCQYGACDFDYEEWNKPNRLSEVRNMDYQYRFPSLFAGVTFLRNLDPRISNSRLKFMKMPCQPQNPLISNPRIVKTAYNKSANNEGRLKLQILFDR